MNLTTSDPTLIFRALGDPSRRAIFERLVKQGEQNVHALTKLSAISQPAVSKHLAVLRRAGLASARHSGRETFYSADRTGLAPMLDWMRFHQELWITGLDRLDALLNQMEKDEQ